MNLLAPALVVLLVISSGTSAASIAPERQADGNTLTSASDPRVRISLPAQAHHVGAHRWVLYDVADCEIHVFVEADEKKQVERLYWIQFEGYIPSRPDLHYDYSEDEPMTIGGRQFFARPGFGESQKESKPGSDREQVHRMLRENGYTLPDHMVNTRLVHLFDDRRKELMIIFAQDMAPLGVTSQELRPGGAQEKRWPEISKQIVQSARARIALEW